MAQPERSHGNDKHFNLYHDGYTDQDPHAGTDDRSPNQDAHHHTHACHMDSIANSDAHCHVVGHTHGDSNTCHRADPAV